MEETTVLKGNGTSEFDPPSFCQYEALDLETIDKVLFWCSTVGVIVIGSLGLVGNVLSFITIFSMKMRNLFYNLLLVLAVFDTIHILAAGLLYTTRTFGGMRLSHPAAMMVSKLLIPLAGAGLTGSTYTCVAIALERYMGICRADSELRRRKFPHFLLFILLIDLAIDGFRLLEIRPAEVQLEEEEDNYYTLQFTELRQNEAYVTFIMWYRLVLATVIPLMLMLILNLRIVYFYKENRQLLFKTTKAEQGESGVSNLIDKKRNQELGLFLLFLCIAITFLVCQVPRLLLNVYEIQLSGRRRRCHAHFGVLYGPPTWYYLTMGLEAVTLTFNSSVNFVFYCWLGRGFRQQMAATLLRGGLARRPGSAGGTPGTSGRSDRT